MPFEYLVRPYQTPASHGRIVLPAAPSSRASATITWGAKVTVSDVVPERTGINVECCSERLAEVSRKTDTIKISGEAPFATENYLLVERATQVKLKKTGENKCGSQLDQMSGVASGIKQAFADLEADIEAGGAAEGETACDQTIHFTENTRLGGSPYPLRRRDG